MKYLIINGSPHKRNTWELVKHAVHTIKKEDKDCKFDVIHLSNCSIPFCTGCSVCFRKGHEFCPHNKQIIPIIKKIQEADGVIVVSTTFMMRETALLKNLFDHMAFLAHRPMFFTKKALVITSVGGVGGATAAKGICSTLKAFGFNRCYRFSAVTMSWNAYQVQKSTRKKLDRMAAQFSNDVQSKVMHSPQTSLLIPYNLFRGMGRYYKKGTEYETEDGVYWLEEERRNKPYDSRIPLRGYQKLVGAIFYGIGNVAGKYMVVTYKK